MTCVPPDAVRVAVLITAISVNQLLGVSKTMSKTIGDLVGNLDLDDVDGQARAVAALPWLPEVLLNDYLGRGNCVSCDSKTFVEVETGDEAEAEAFAQFITEQIFDESLCMEHQPLMWLAYGMALTATVIFAAYPSDPVDFEARLLTENEYVMCALSAEGLDLMWQQFGLPAMLEEAAL